MNPTETPLRHGAIRDGRRLRGERARAAVLDHAARLLSVEGVEGLTFGRVAELAGIGKSNLQVLFGDRLHLQQAALAHAVDLYRAEVVEPALRRRTPLTRLRALVEGWFDFVANRRLPGGCVINAAGSEYRARPGPLRELVQHYRLEARERMQELIEQAKASGQLAVATDARQLVTDLLALQAFANVAALMGDEADFQRARRAALARIAANAQ